MFGLFTWHASVPWLSEHIAVFSNFVPNLFPVKIRVAQWGSNVGCRISWLWVSLCGITGVSLMSSAFGCSNLKYHNLKCRWAFSYRFSLEESETSYTSKFPRYENWSSWNSRNKWIERLQLMNFWTEKPSAAKELNGARLTREQGTQEKEVFQRSFSWTFVKSVEAK